MNANEKNEIRTLEGFLAVREQNGEGTTGESRTIYGRAIVFNSESELLDDFGMQFREVIRPQAVTMDWLMTQDIKLNILHDRKQTVARWNKGKGNLRMNLTDEGLDFEFEAPKCDLGDRALEMVRSGVYSGCSFEFYPDKYDVTERGKDDVLVSHTHFRAITALTIGMDPAYTATSVNARELYEQHHQETDEEKAQREAAEAAKREEERKAEEAKAEQERLEREAMAVLEMRRKRIMNQFVQ